MKDNSKSNLVLLTELRSLGQSYKIYPTTQTNGLYHTRLEFDKPTIIFQGFALESERKSMDKAFMDAINYLRSLIDFITTFRERKLFFVYLVCISLSLSFCRTFPN